MGKLSLVKGEYSGGDVFCQGRVVLIRLIHSLGFGYPLMILIIDEDILFEYGITFLDRRKAGNGFERFSLWNEYLALGGNGDRLLHRKHGTEVS